MGDFFASIYELAISVFGDDLANYLSGSCTNFEGGLYARVGLSLIIITALSVLFYYFFYVNSKRNKPKYWFLIMSISGLICGIIAFYLPYAELSKGFVCSQYLFATGDTLFFGLINTLFSMCLFFLLSLGVKFIGKADGRFIPFKF